MPRLSAKERRRKKERKEFEQLLDSTPGNRFPPRGRPPKVIAKEIAGRAENYRWIFDRVWDELWPLLAKANTEQEVDQAFHKGASTYYKRSDVWSPALVLGIIHEPKFPKTRDAQVNFFADSLAALGEVAPRSSRDICAKYRAEQKRANHIIRFEVWIECSCGFKGLSVDHACPECDSEVPFPWHSAFPI